MSTDSSKADTPQADTPRADTAKRRKALEAMRRRRREEREQAILERAQFYGLQIDPSASFYDEASDREPGDTNWVGFGFDLHPSVTMVSAALLAVFIGGTLIFRNEAEGLFNSMLSGINGTFGWFYILAANIFIIAMLVFAFSGFGKIRIGGPDALPEFSDFAWYAMLLSAGMGIGLMFWSVAEPIFHYMDPSPMFGVAAETPAAAQAAFATTYFHWGLHPWGIYALVGLGLAFFAYNRGLPLTIRSVFYPLLGERIYGFWGNVIDILSVLATLFGLATSLGIGVQQVSAGLNFLFGLPTAVWFQVVLIGIITGFATLSVIAGLDGGVKRLSEWNMYLAGGLMLFVLLLGPTVYIFSSLTQSVGYYIQKLPQLSLWAETFHNEGWQAGWTVFYWGWWISWSPFVGMFIARVSKGRTVREFILSVMLFPTLLSFVWLSVFGGAAIWLQSNGLADIAAAVNADVSTALFAMLQSFPLTSVSSLIGIVLVVFFFVTSSDSGSLVVDHLTSGGKLDSPVPQRVFWAVMEGLCAAVLLVGGGLSALQTASITTGLPFALVLLIMVYSMHKAFREELFHLDVAEIHESMKQTEEEDRMMLDAMPSGLPAD